MSPFGLVIFWTFFRLYFMSVFTTGPDFVSAFFLVTFPNWFFSHFFSLSLLFILSCVFLLTHFRWACVGQRLGPAAQVHPPRVRQPPHLPLTHLRCRDLHLHGEQLQGHRWGVRWPRGLGWVCRVAFFLKKTTNSWCLFLIPKQSFTITLTWQSVEFYWEAFLWGTRSCCLIIKHSFRYKSALLCE